MGKSIICYEILVDCRSNMKNSYSNWHPPFQLNLRNFLLQTVILSLNYKNTLKYALALWVTILHVTIVNQVSIPFLHNYHYITNYMVRCVGYLTCELFGCSSKMSEKSNVFVWSILRHIFQANSTSKKRVHSIYFQLLLDDINHHTLETLLSVFWKIVLEYFHGWLRALKSWNTEKCIF